MNINKIKSYLGFSIKSGKVVFGFDNLLKSKKLPYIILISSTQNEKVTNKIVNFAKREGIEVIKLNELTLEDLVCRDNCKVIGVLDFNLAKVISDELKMEN